MSYNFTKNGENTVLNVYDDNNSLYASFNKNGDHLKRVRYSLSGDTAK